MYSVQKSRSFGGIRSEFRVNDPADAAGTPIYGRRTPNVAEHGRRTPNLNSLRKQILS